MNKTIISILRAQINGVDMISKTKSGNFIFRKGYFYTGGQDEDILVRRLEEKLFKLGLTAKLIDCGNHWAPFKGAAPIQRQSHFYVEFKITA